MMILMLAAHAKADCDASVTPQNKCSGTVDPGPGENEYCWGGCSTTPIFGCDCSFVKAGSNCHVEKMSIKSGSGCLVGGCKRACCVQCDGTPSTTATTTPTPTCSATDTDGDWISIETLQGAIELSISYGTVKTNSESNTSSWSNSVTKAVKVGFKFASAGVNSTVAQTTANQYADQWSAFKLSKYTVSFPATDAGKQLWQYVINIQDNCSHSVQTLTMDYSLTEGVYQKPCCPAGWGQAPNHTTDYQACHAPAEKASWCSSTAEYFTA